MQATGSAVKTEGFNDNNHSRHGALSVVASTRMHYYFQGIYIGTMLFKIKVLKAENIQFLYIQILTHSLVVFFTLKCSHLLSKLKQINMSASSD